MNTIRKNWSVVLSTLIILQITTGAHAVKVELSGHIEGQARWFPSSPAYPTQKKSRESVSFALEPEWKYLTRDRRHDFKISPFIRYDAEDKERTHVDIRELYWLYKGDEWEILAGINQVFWGVAESRHLVDIINQTDLVEDLDEEDKLGQPMIRLTMELKSELKLAQAPQKSTRTQQQDLGKLTLFLMPGFRERTFPGSKARLSTPFPVDQDTARFPGGASKDRIDLALRYSHTIGDWDIGLHYFHGNSREPSLIPDLARGRLIPQYDLINQLGVDIQYTSDAWLGKFEGIIREGQGKTFGALVAGIEYTNYQIFESDADLGLLVEYLHDGRDDNFAPKTIFDNDIFLGTRLSLNDTQSTQVLAGIVSDIETSEYSFSLEAERRINNNIKLELLVRAFGASDPKDTLASIEEDDYAQVSVFYHF
uniref:Alginate export domain-containing protein n=1 Tax=Candidatus Kentrum sp. FW TaxID=2126338 RepID=A0A450TVW9_9GAMM|nr:MAG: hypothetical protein BECKFW1821C_GA0114237_104521 [Candidatus Kentron sp. FW]